MLMFGLIGVLAMYESVELSARPETVAEATLMLAQANVQRAAEDGDVDAQYQLALDYLGGRDVDADPRLAAQWMTKAATGGHARASYRLGLMYRDGIGVAKDRAKAKHWLELAAGIGLSDAKPVLSGLNRLEAHDEIQRVQADARRGVASAQSQLGRWYNLGYASIARDPEQAQMWLRKAADQRDVDAALELGLIFLEQKSDAAKLAEARQWLTLAARHGSLKARVILNDLDRADPNKTSLGAGSDPFERAAEAGDHRAQFDVGVRYFEGRETVRDVARGLAWLHRAAEADHLDAQMYLADAYLRGVNMDVNYADAAKWYTRAAQQGNSDAQYMIANQYRLGLGVKRDFTEAKRWYTAAAGQGHVKAKERLAEASSGR